MEVNDEIIELVGDIWGSVLGITAVPAPASLREEELRLTGFVHIHGDWEGTVTVDCPLPLATEAAAAMFGMSVEELSKEEIDDALGEITNMTGGGIKSMLEGSCKLSLPTVIEGVGFTVKSPGAELSTELTFAAGGSWMVVRVLEHKDEADAAVVSEQILAAGAGA
jgi:chemotaxis protein CheX